MALVWTLLADVRTRCLLFGVALLLCVTGSRAAVLEVTSLPPPLTNAPPPAPGAKFLFIFETSSAMKRFEHEGRQVVFDLVYSGISNQMHSADTYGIWTFNEQVSAGLFPMQVWSGENSLDQASKIGVFLKSERYRGKPRADLAIAKALTVVKSVKDVNVLLVMSGESSLGTSELEVKLRDTYQRKSELARQQKLPVVLAFCATDGEIALASVTLAGERIQLREDLLAKARQPIKKPVPVPAPAVVAQASPVTNHMRAPIIMIGQPKPTLPAGSGLAPVSTNPSGTESNTLASSVLPAAAQAEEGNATNALPQQSNVPVNSSVASNSKEPQMDLKPATSASVETEKGLKSTSAKTVVQASSSNAGEHSKLAPERTSRLPDLLPAPLKVAAREPGPDTGKPNSTPAVVAAIPPLKSPSEARWTMILGVGFFAAALGLSAWAIFRLRQSRQTSYISRAMTRRQ